MSRPTELQTALIAALLVLTGCHRPVTPLVTRLHANAGRAPTMGSFNRHLVELGGSYYTSTLVDQRVALTRIDSEGGARHRSLPYRATQPAVLVADKQGRLHVSFSERMPDGGRFCHYLRLKPEAGNPDVFLATELDIRFEAFSCGSKFAATYDARSQRLFWSHRDAARDLHLLVLDANFPAAGPELVVADAHNPVNLLARHALVRHVGDIKSAPRWNAHYHSVAVDPTGRLHLAINPHYWPGGPTNAYVRRKVFYLYSDDGGDSWRDAAGRPVPVPVATDACFESLAGSPAALPRLRPDCRSLGTDLTPAVSNAWIASLLVSERAVDVLYFVESDRGPVGEAGLYYQHLRQKPNSPDQYVLAEPQRLDGLGVHASLVMDPHSNVLYAFSDRLSGGHALWRRDPLSGSWRGVGGVDAPPRHDRHFFSTALPEVSRSDERGWVVGLTTDQMSRRGVGRTRVCDVGPDQDGCRLDTANASGALQHASRADLVSSPLPRNFRSLRSALQQGIGLGPLPVVQGLTLEGWFRPSAPQAAVDAPAGPGHLFTRGAAWRPGDYALKVLPDGALELTLFLSNPEQRLEWRTRPGALVRNRWSYLAVTWQRHSPVVRFSLRTADGSEQVESVNNPDLLGDLPETGDEVFVGFVPAIGRAGFDGDVSAIRVSDTALHRNQLAITGGPDAYNDVLLLRYPVTP